ncbi:golgin subfamily A member 6-like protein 4 [Ptychodera flava]|uniref:golgin subfamily A member 6-like protein 4 n=1 Tax=Ptychodera flava TaxID=63121 RepID=UPI00396A6C04
MDEEQEVEQSEDAEGLEEQLEELKQAKAKSKAAFTRLRHQLLRLLEEDEEEELPSRRQVRDLCLKLDLAQENAMDIMAKLSDLHSRRKAKQNIQKVSQEMDKLENEYTEAQNQAQDYIHARKDETSSAGSGVPTNIRLRQQKEREARHEVEKILEEVNKKEKEIITMKKDLEEENERRQYEWDKQMQHEHERLQADERNLQKRFQELENEVDMELGLRQQALPQSNITSRRNRRSRDYDNQDHAG